VPFRKRPYLWEEVERRLQQLGTYEDQRKTPAMLLTVEIMTERIWASIRIFGLMLFFLFMLLVALQIQLTNRNADIARVGAAARDARLASIAAKEALDAAIKQSQDPAQIAPFLEMVKRTERIELRLCGGPCPTK